MSTEKNAVEQEKTEHKESKKPNWVKLSPAELEKIVVDLGKKGETPAKIGLILRDKHGIPKAKVIGKKITHILRDNKIPFKAEKERTQEKIKKLNVHLSNNKIDFQAKKSLAKELWVMHKIEKKAAN